MLRPHLQPQPKASTWGMGRWFCALILGLAGAHVQAGEAPVEQPSVLAHGRWIITHERWDLPADETMGMWGGRLLWDLGEGWRVGPAAYGAVQGQRGGFITLGVEGERSWRLGPHWELDAGLFVGAGGGRGGLELAGGGLMLRAHAGVSWALSPRDRLGVGVSHVRFPSQGAIRSSQPFVRYERRFDSWLTPGWDAEPRGWKREPGWHRFGLRWRHMKPDAPSARTDTRAQVGTMDLLGAEWQSQVGTGPVWLGLAADGAVGGNSAGYMQMLGQVGWLQPLWPGGLGSVWFGVGPAGGGGVDTGGGLLMEAGASLGQRLTRDWALEVGWLRQHAPQGRFGADGLMARIVYQPGNQADSSPAASLALPLRVRWLHQTYRGKDAAWRSFDADTPVRLMGVAVDAMAGQTTDAVRWYATGQGLAAYAGRAGAYMEGWVGPGLRWAWSDRLALEAEALLGAGGGGGLRTGGGAMAQGRAALTWRIGRHASVAASLGHVRAVRGDLRARSAGVVFIYDLTAWPPKP